MRWLIVSVAICFAIYWIVDGTVAIMTQEKPPWVEALSIIASLLLGLFAGLTPIWLAVRRFRMYIKEHNKRKVEVEMELDPNRTSSEINEDGTFHMDS